MNVQAGLRKWRACVCVDLDRGAVSIGAGWPDGNMTQQTKTVTSTTSSLVQPRTGCVLPTQHTQNVVIHVIVQNKKKEMQQRVKTHGQLKYITINSTYILV